MNHKIAIYSPAVCGSIGHGFVYGLSICKNLNNQIDYSLFTISDTQCIKILLKNGINIKTSKKFLSGVTDKKKFLKFGVFSKPIYGVFRMYYHIMLLKEFYNVNTLATRYHLFEFEYIAALLYFAFNKKKLNKTILSFHSSDFYWIKGRPLTVNAYKSALKVFLPFLVKNSYSVTTHGQFLKNELVKSLKLQKFESKISAIPYGCNDSVADISKEASRKILGLDLNKKYGLFFGVLREDKGLIELIKYLPNINEELNLIIAGAEGDIKESTVVTLIEKLGLKHRVVLNIKYLTDKEVQLYYSASDLIFITHKSYHVAFSGPLSLAVEFKRPVVSTDYGEIGSFVKKYRIGKTFHSEDWNDLKNVTNDFLKEPFEINKSFFIKCLSENSWKTMSKKLLDIYEK